MSDLRDMVGALVHFASAGFIVINCHFLKSVLLHVLDDAEYFWKKLFFDLKKISKFFEPLKKNWSKFF